MISGGKFFMSQYVENNLGKGEEIVLKAKKSLWCLLPQVIASVVIIVAFFLLKSLLELDEMEQVKYFFETGKKYVNPLSSLVWVPFVLAIIIIGVKLLTLWGMNLAVTNKRVIGKIGVLKVQTLDYHIDKVDNVSFNGGLWGNLFRYYTVVVQGGGNNAKIKFIGIANANEFKNAVNEAIEKHAEEARKQQAEEIARAMGKE